MIRNINRSGSRQLSPGNEDSDDDDDDGDNANDNADAEDNGWRRWGQGATFRTHSCGRSALWHRPYCQGGGTVCSFLFCPRCLLLNTHSKRISCWWALSIDAAGRPPLTPCATYKHANTHMSRRSVTYFISVFMCVYKVLIFISLCQTLLNNFSDRETRDLESNIANGGVYTRFVRTYGGDERQQGRTNESSRVEWLKVFDFTLSSC